MNLNIVRIICIVAVLCAVGLVPCSAQEPAFKIVVNSANPIDSLSDAQIAAIFLKLRTRWEDGQAIQPIDLENGSPTRDSFSQAVFHREAEAIEARWMRKLFSGEMVPPIRVKTDQEVLRAVASQPGAIGYVSSDAETSGEVKTIAITGL